MGNKRVLVWGAGGHGKVIVDALMARRRMGSGGDSG